MNMFLNAAQAQLFQPRISMLDAEARKNAGAVLADIAQGVMDYEVINGIAVIGVAGILVSAQIPCWYCYGNLTYESLVNTVRDAVESSEVESAVIRFYSPGGTVLGCAEAAAHLDILAKEKAVVSHCAMADSAAYWLASATNRIYIDPTGEAGSIGVIAQHVDMSKMLEDWGITVTNIHAGDHKADGSPYHPLTRQAKERWQAEVDQLRDIFVSNVATFRGLDPKAVKDTEALTYIGKSAVEVGLADDVTYFNDLLPAIKELAFEEPPKT